MVLLWGNTFYSSTSATRSSARSRGGGVYNHPVSVSADLISDVLYGVQVKGHCWPCHIKHSDFLNLSCDNSGMMWWSIIIHEQKVGGSLADLGDDDGFYDVSEVRTCSDWDIYNNQTYFALNGVTFPECCSSFTKANTWDHVDLGVLITSLSPATMATIIFVQGDPTLISDHWCALQITWSSLHCKR